ncbi:MAG TPA: CAP domain-containing protein [Acidimicrobiia bacterium]
MNRSRLPAVTAAAVLLIGTAIVWNGESRYPRQISTGTTPATTTTTVFELPAIVASGMVNTEEETNLIEEATTVAAEATTTTAPPTTTTIAMATTATTARPSPTTTEATEKAPTTTTPPSTTAPPTTAAGGYDSSAESDFASRINTFREGNGASSLTRDGSLDSYARSWAKKMADDGGLSHSNIGSLVPPWSSVGENVGTGGSVGQVFDALVSSGSHSSTMLADFTHLGVGVYRDSAGALWTVHVFTR